MKKKIIDWYKDELEEPYKSEALKVLKDYETGDKMVDSLYKALKNGFIWNFTKLDKEFPGCWGRLAIKIKQKEELNNN